MAIVLMTQYIREQLYVKPRAKIGDSNFRAEALFYCSDNNYEYKKAKQAFDDDLKFETEALEHQKRKKNKRWFGLFWI